MINFEILSNLLVYVIAVNLFLSGLAAGLNKIKDLTKSDVDNKAFAVVSKICDYLSKVIDIASANIKH